MAPSLLAASTTAVVWLTVGLVTIVAVAAMVISLVRHVLLIGRAVGRMNDEIGPIMAEIRSRTPSGRAVEGGRADRRRP